MHLPFWLTIAGLSPLLIYQGRKARRHTLRLPEAGGDPYGQYGEGIPHRRVLILGESTAAGVGVQHHDQGLASQLARLWHERTGQTIAWHTFGINGATLTELNHKLPTALPEADIVLLSMGVNDTTGFTPRRSVSLKYAQSGELMYQGLKEFPAQKRKRQISNLLICLLIW